MEYPGVLRMALRQTLGRYVARRSRPGRAHLGTESRQARQEPAEESAPQDRRSPGAVFPVAVDGPDPRVLQNLEECFFMGGGFGRLQGDAGRRDDRWRGR